ncbi:MAG: PilT/PilU family type 4a pilus ATPase [Planctomycetes bacterium]|jgi:twitching motility protein PilT|nr:PilT/PilU family type 4a pilus ATPase [Planctomycetota bacterium]
MISIKDLLKFAALNRASDLHLIVGLMPFLRIDGELVAIDSLFSSKLPSKTPAFKRSSAEIAAYVKKVENSEMLKALDELLDKDKKEKFIQEKELDFSCSVDDSRYRVNLSWEKGNIKLVARVISSLIPSMEEILMPQTVYELLNLKQGLILVTGPSGSGKSTSLAAMVNYINSHRACNMITVEDPIEFLFTSDKSLISQREMEKDTNSFGAALKHVLRQDPNVVMIGEMRDLETISAAITLAETGHLILATLHTGNASQTIDRIIDIFPPHQQNQVRTQLSMVLTAVISQKLLVKVGGGLVAAREVMVRNTAISNLIKDGKVGQIKNVIETGQADGMISFTRSVKELLKSTLISDETAKNALKDERILG